MNQPIKTAMGWREWAMLMTLSLLWGGSFFFVEVAITQLPPLTIVLSRVALAAIVLWIVALAMGIKPPARAADWISFAIMGLINNVIPFTLLAWGQIHIASGLAAILNATTPIFTVLVAGMLLDDERMTTGKLIGIGTGFCGVVVMIGPQALAGLGSTRICDLSPCSPPRPNYWGGIMCLVHCSGS